MIFKDISQDNIPTYTLSAGEQYVFFMLNRSGDIVFELIGEQATAHVIAFFVGTGHDETTLTIAQRHLAAHTSSHVIVKSVLHEAAQFSYKGTIHIAPQATCSDASQENRNLLLSSKAKAFSQPALEILTSDVKCHHAAATGPLNREQLCYLQARGLSYLQAKKLLTSGFFRSALDTIDGFISREEKEKMLSLIEQSTY